MNKRRKFLKIGVGFLAGTVLMFGPLFSTVRWVFAFWDHGDNGS
jgi:hypothetical protein